MDNRIETIVQQMRADGKSDELIQEFIRRAEEKLAGKTEGSPKTETPAVSQNAMGSESASGSSDLPEITYKDVDLPETQAIEVLKKKIGGLGFTFEETGAFGFVPFTDYVNITSPPDANGNTVTQRFSFDQWFGKRQSEADGINAFVNEHANKSQAVNASEYARAWNQTNKRAKQQKEYGKAWVVLCNKLPLM